MGCRLGRPRRGRSAEQGEERETELLETLDKEQRILEGRHEEAGQVLQTTYEREKGALTYSFQESKALLQDHGSPGPFWEQELESLHHVIELKNERIHELERQLLLVDMLKEKNLILALKNTTLRQEIEDLHFRAGNRAATSRQFWKDVLQVLERGSQDGHHCNRRRSH